MYGSKVSKFLLWKNEPYINSLHFDDSQKSVSFQISYIEKKMKCKEVRCQNPYFEKKNEWEEVRFQNSYIEKNQM